MSEYIWSVAKVKDSELMDYIEFCDLNRPLAMALLNRNIKPNQVDAYFQASLSTLTDPSRFPTMEKAVKRIWQAVREGQKIVVHGDYDTDGVTSSTLIHWLIKAYGGDIEIFISNRMEDGYGPTPKTMQRAKDLGAEVVITTDCGITSYEAADKAVELGIDLIITDHHTPAARLPEAFAIVNPRMHDELIDLHGLAGVGVAFKLCHAFAKNALKNGVKERPVDIREGLDLVALGTVADLSPLTGENRALVRNGLKLISLRRRPGLRSLLDSLHIDHRISPNDISRRIAPRINAAGRVGDPMVSVQLLCSESINNAQPHVTSLDGFNRKRRYVERRALKEAMEIAKHEILTTNPGGLVIIGKDWHPGIIGLLATRVTNEYSLPTIVLSNDQETGELLGSGRSKSGDDILDIMFKCDHLMTTYGGHPMAVGLSLPAKNAHLFKEHFLSHFKTKKMSQGNVMQKLYADGEATIDDFDENFFEQYEQFEPFGNGNPEPVYFLSDIEVVEMSEFGNHHTRGTIEDVSGQIPFVLYGCDMRSLPPQPWEIMATPRSVSISGALIQQLVILDLRTQ